MLETAFFGCLKRQIAPCHFLYPKEYNFLNITQCHEDSRPTWWGGFLLYSSSVRSKL